MRLSHRYISGRQLPDKAISVLDTACAKVALGQSATPALIENAHRASSSASTPKSARWSARRPMAAPDNAGA